MACPNCGSWAVKADRSLAGRMVCARCGEPLGIGPARRVSSGIRRRGQGRGSLPVLPRRWRLWFGLGALLTLSALLATLPARPDRPGERPPAWPGRDTTRGGAPPGAPAAGATAGGTGG